MSAATEPKSPAQWAVVRRELEAWLGDDHGLADAQIDELARVSDSIQERYPDPDDNDEREAALIAAYRVMQDGSAVVDELAASLAKARTNELRALAGLRQAAVMLIGNCDGEDVDTQRGFARRAGVDRMAVREWLGVRDRGSERS